MERRPGAGEPPNVRIVAPAVEMRTRGECVVARRKRHPRVFAEIREDVDKRISHLSWRNELAPMPAISPKTAASQEELVHAQGDSNRETPDAGRQCSLVARFDDEVDVVPLDGKLHDAKMPGIALSCALNGEAKRRKDVLAAEWPKE